MSSQPAPPDTGLAAPVRTRPGSMRTGQASRAGARPRPAALAGLRLGLVLVAGLVALGLAGCATGIPPGGNPATGSAAPRPATPAPSATTTTDGASAAPSGGVASAGPGSGTPESAEPRTAAPPPDPTPVERPASGVPASASAGALPPPVALSLPAGGTVMGALGGYTWNGNGSEAPWIVPSAAHAVRSGGPFTATLDAALGIETWTARWAPVEGETVGDVAGSAQGTSRPITFSGPTTPGTFGLSLDVTFVEGGQATWYWRLEPHI